MQSTSQDEPWEKRCRRQSSLSSSVPGPFLLFQIRRRWLPTKRPAPDVLNKIIRLAELEQRQRHIRARAPEVNARLGMFCGLVIGVAGLVAACYIAKIGAPGSGMLLGAADLLGLVSVFISGSRHVPRLPGRMQSSSTQKSKSLPEEAALPQEAVAPREAVAPQNTTPRQKAAPVQETAPPQEAAPSREAAPLVPTAPAALPAQQPDPGA